MLSTKSWCSAVLTGTLLVLCSSPMLAALRSRTNTMRAKPHGTLHISRTTAGRHGAQGKQSARSRKSTKARAHGQQAIDPVRTLEIQQALIRAQYLSGEPTGQWDQATRDALIRLQDDNHWQTKVVPDSRALIKLGLGPSQQNLLNPESAAIAIATPGRERAADSGN
jgi:putative peptidoglycan binding protein